MSLPRAHTRHSVEEYLASERGAEERHEHLGGQLYAEDDADYLDRCRRKLRSQPSVQKFCHGGYCYNTKWMGIVTLI